VSKNVPIGVRVKDLRPTQMTVGYREVAAKRRQWREANGKERLRLLRRHVIPAVIGPRRRTYIVDHHHFARALLDEDAGRVAVAWCHAYDADGKRRKLSRIPKNIGELADDPFRSLVGALMRRGGCAKSDQPFAEFLWADFLRRRINRRRVQQDFDAALKSALALARGKDARSLPGWCGKGSEIT